MKLYYKEYFLYYDFQLADEWNSNNKIYYVYVATLIKFNNFIYSGYNLASFIINHFNSHKYLLLNYKSDYIKIINRSKDLKELLQLRLSIKQDLQIEEIL